MKKEKKVIPEPQLLASEDTVSTDGDVSSIQEFIELKKLQNQILRKMLEKNIPPSNKENSKTK